MVRSLCCIVRKNKYNGILVLKSVGRSEIITEDIRYACEFNTSILLQILDEKTLENINYFC